MKPLGTNNVAENELTTPKSAFGKSISQCGLSTKSLKPLGTYHTRENVISANKSAFEPTNSTSRISAKKFNSVNTEIEYRYDSFDFKLLPLDLAIWLRFLLQTNALLRCEARNTESAAYHLNH
ncbi:hypothetical protein ACVS57_004566 [Vibrio parahaemolyticus]|uniref:hypothetical protein n=1 Tax=Vibrio parahaemolyticus TaxID=670 RepID=UPI002D1FBE4A|nr:hypothetical protein [Vibrio parahaemolyticus]